MSKSPLLRYALAAAVLLGACFSGVLGVASYLFHRGDRRSVELAARLVPFNSDYLSRLSSYYPDRRTELLQKAAAFNPYSEQVWLQLGFDAEFRHQDVAAAEKYYLKAADVSHLYLPRWTLTNFYFRRQNKPAFLKWARLALEITPYSADPIFTEMWLMNPGSSNSIASELPSRPAILEQYFDFLMTAGQYAFVPPVIDRLVASAPPSQARYFGLDDAIGPALDKLLGAGYLPEALRIWTTLSTAHWIPFRTPTPDRPLTNGSFEPLYGHGFDWFVLNSPGTSFGQSKASAASGHPSEITLEFSGDQAESCELLLQWLPLGPSRNYRLQWKANSTGLTTPAGISWHLGASSFSLQSPDLFAEHAVGWEFQIPPNNHIALLTLEYKRPLGQTIAQGTLHVQAVSLQPE